MDLTDIKHHRTLLWNPIVLGLLLTDCLSDVSSEGMIANRKIFATRILPGVDHLPHTRSLPDTASSRSQPTWGAHLASDLERLVALHDASSIAAAIVKPMAGNQSQRRSSYWGSYA